MDLAAPSSSAAPSSAPPSSATPPSSAPPTPAATPPSSAPPSGSSSANAHPRRPDYRGEELDPERGPGLGCFWFQAIVLGFFIVLIPIGLELNWPFELLAILLFVVIGLLLLTGQTVIFLLRLVAADRRSQGRRRPLASPTRTVGELEDELATPTQTAPGSQDAPAEPNAAPAGETMESLTPAAYAASGAELKHGPESDVDPATAARRGIDDGASMIRDLEPTTGPDPARAARSSTAAEGDPPASEHGGTRTGGVPGATDPADKASRLVARDAMGGGGAEGAAGAPPTHESSAVGRRGGGDSMAAPAEPTLPAEPTPPAEPAPPADAEADARSAPDADDPDAPADLDPAAPEDPDPGVRQ
jgi:hypothetical protein